MTIDTDVITASSQIDRIIVMKSNGEELFTCTLAELLAALGVGGGGSASFTTVTPSATTGTATVACGSNALCWSALTTSGNLTLNVTGSGVQSIRLRITLGGTHTVAFQYAGSAGNVKWPGGQAPSFGTTSGTVFMVEGIADGTVLEITNYYPR